jgi:signal transduction histidine kinase/CheY-like chemotaxis protein
VAIVGKPQLVVLVGTGAGRGYTIDARLTIGRDPDCDVWIPDTDVTRNHAVVERTPGDEFVLRDLGSRNGTRVNGTRVQERVLKIGDMVGVAASTVLMFTHHDPVQDQFMHLQKMEALGQLAGGVAHDFNNLLAVIANNALFLQGPPCGWEAVNECAQEISQAVERGAGLTQSLLEFARSGRYDEKPVDLSHLLDDAIALARRTFDRAIEISADLHPNQTVAGDRLQLFQVMMNILLNAKDAMPDGGRLVVASEIVELHDADVATRPLRTGPHARVRIQDDGVGMDEVTRRRVFEPFFTTKDKTKGTGLGLSMAYGIVKRHRGHIEVDARPQRGSVFTIFLPLLPDVGVPEVRRRQPTGDMARVQKGCVLVVDDDELVVRSTTRLLQSLGFETLEARDGAEAVAAFEEHRTQIDVVLLDLVMPNVSGTQTFHILKKLDPQVRVLLTSGYTDHQNVDTLLERGACGFIPKPPQASTLGSVITELLGKRPAR